MAEKGKGKKIRFQGGTVFPLTVLLVSVIGLALIVYARSSTQALAVPPQASKGDHWHVAFGVYACNDWLPNVSGNKEDVNGSRTRSTWRSASTATTTASSTTTPRARPRAGATRSSPASWTSTTSS